MNPASRLEACESRIERGFAMDWELGEQLRDTRRLLGEDAFRRWLTDHWTLPGSPGEYIWCVELRERLEAAGCDPLPRFMHQIRDLLYVRGEGLSIESDYAAQIEVWNEACRRATS